VTILHSAKQRNTRQLKGEAATAFWRKWNMTESQEVRNHLVEEYF